MNVHPIWLLWIDLGTVIRIAPNAVSAPHIFECSSCILYEW